MLSFDAEQVTGGEIVNGVDAGFPAALLLHVGHVVGLKVAARVADDPVDEGEDQPADKEAGGEGQQGVAPLHVDAGGEEIAEELAPLPADFLQVDIALATLGHDPLLVALQVADQSGSNDGILPALVGCGRLEVALQVQGL